MKVLLVAHENGAGGVSSHVTALSNELANLGHNVRVAWHTNNGKDTNLPLNSKNPVSLFLSSIGLLKLLKGFSPDVVHVHSRMPLLAILPWAKTMKIPIVYTVHGNYSPHRLSKLVGMADIVISLCSSHTDYIVSKLEVDPEKIRIVGNGVDTNRFKPIHVEKDPGIFNIGLVGRLVNAKGFSFFLNVFSHLPIKAKLTIVGDGDLKESLREEAESLGVISRVDFLGDRNDVEGIYPTFDLFCLPSIKEVFPFALLEAMSCGLPCVASDVGCVQEIGKNAVIVLPKADTTMWVKSLLRLIDDEDGRQKLASRALERSKSFSWQCVAKRVEGTYLEAIKR